MTRRHRLDDELVEQGFFSNREDAMRAVMAGEVSTQDRRLERAGEQVERGIVLHVRGHIPFVSRGGLKLERVAFRPLTLIPQDSPASTWGVLPAALLTASSSVVLPRSFRWMWAMRSSTGR